MCLHLVCVPSVTTGRFLGKDPVTNASGTEVNNTVNPYVRSSGACDTEIMIMTLVFFIIAVSGVAGNAVVIWLLGFHIRRNVFSVYILNLAAADLILLSFYLITLLYTIAFPSASVNDSYIKFSLTVLFSSYLTGLGLLSAISMERCLSVLCPIWYRCHRPRHMSVIIIGILWILPLVFGILSRICSRFCYLVAASIAIYLSCLVLILCGSNLGLLGRVCCASPRIAFTRLYVTILLTFLVFLFCGLPLGIFTVVQNFLNLFTFYSHLCDPSLVVVVVFILSCVNSAVNPVIYLFVGSFRQSKHRNLRLVLQKALQDTPERDEHVGSPPQEMSGLRVEQA